MEDLGLTLLRLERVDDAIATHEEVVQIRRRLAADDPAQREDLIHALQWHEKALRSVGRLQDTQQLIEELVALRQGLPPGTRLATRWVFRGDDDPKWQPYA